MAKSKEKINQIMLLDGIEVGGRGGGETCCSLNSTMGSFMSISAGTPSLCSIYQPNDSNFNNAILH